jgi:hypothetical protein
MWFCEPSQPYKLPSPSGSPSCIHANITRSKSPAGSRVPKRTSDGELSGMSSIPAARACSTRRPCISSRLAFPVVVAKRIDARFPPHDQIPSGPSSHPCRRMIRATWSGSKRYRSNTGLYSACWLR